MPKHLLLALLLIGYLGTSSFVIARPNVLLIAVDDLNDWIGCLGGHPDTHTPNLDRLAASGTLFTNAHCQGTMCNPSRISILWGMRPSTTGFYDNHYPVKKHPEFMRRYVNLPRHFAANGYKTITAGKIFHSGTPPQSQITGPTPGQWQRKLDKRVHAKPKQYHSIWDFGPQDYPEDQFVDHLVSNWAAEKLNRKHNQPFFLSVGFYRPHVPFFPPRRVYDKVTEATLPPSPEDDWHDVPDAARAVAMSNPKIPTHDWMSRENRWQLAVRSYLACIRWTDEQIGRILDALAQSPHADNTIVVLFSDHGYHLGEKQRWSKFSLWERTTRVPLIIRVPGKQPAKTSQPVELLSIYPTLADLCGLRKPAHLEGHSLKPLLNAPKAPWPHVAISTLGQNNHAIRDARYRYVRYADGSQELYDHQSDPNEWHNLAHPKPAPEAQSVITRLRQHLPATNAPQRQ